jgi:hypothetical protein
VPLFFEEGTVTNRPGSDRLDAVSSHSRKRGTGQERSHGARSDSSRWPTMSARVMGRDGERCPQLNLAEPR